jgi:hypothetical protein
MNKYFPYILVVALLLFISLFVFRQVGWLDFWWWMSANLVVILFLGLLSDGKFRKRISGDLTNSVWKKMGLGFLSAILLYLIFFMGNEAVRFLFDFANRDIGQVYGFKEGAGTLRIGLLMLLIIGPGEELLWRGYIQGNLAERYGNREGFIIAALVYAAIHVATGNLVLVLAALTGGLFWGWMYMKYRSVLMNSVSHLVWDLAVFLVFPFSA